MRMAKFILIPTMIASIRISCTHDEQDPELSTRATDIRISASVPTDIQDLAGVRLKLTPARHCEGFFANVDEDATAYVEDLDVAQMVWPSGEPISHAADQQSHALAEARFIDVVPGCYDVIAAPLDVLGAPLVNCEGPTIPLDVDVDASMIVDLPIICGELPREEVDGNFAPKIDALEVEPEISACDMAKVCATASDGDHDMLVFEWPRPPRLEPSASTAPWPTIVEHQVNPDRSVTQCIRVQAHEPGIYDIQVGVYDVVRPDASGPPVRIQDGLGMPATSHATASVMLDATAGCAATGRSAVILLTLNDNPGLAMAYARTLIGNTVLWATESAAEAPKVLVVLDDNHHGEDARDGEFVHAQLAALDISADYLREPSGGLTPELLDDYELVWLVNPSREVDDASTHTALLRHRQKGGAVVLQGNDIARFRGNPQFMEPLTYLSWQGNGSIACGTPIDEDVVGTYTVEMFSNATESHPIMTGLQGVSFEYGNDIDSTVPLGKGERVLAWAAHETPGCVVRIPVVIALEPGELMPW
jgi:hypothetical protein